MKRIEIIANRSIEEDMHDLFQRRGIVKNFTKIPEVHGTGSSGPKRGDHIWPEENFIIITYCDDEEAGKIIEAVRDLKVSFENEGIKVFAVECVSLLE